MRKLRTRRPRRGGLTLMEIMLVLVILGILGSMAALFLKGAQRTALTKATRAEISVFETALEQYYMMTNTYPSAQEGLQALLQNVSNNSKWTGPYIKQNDLLDEWGNQYDYQPGDSSGFGEPIITSGGPDGSIGTEDDIFSNDQLQQQR